MHFTLCFVAREQGHAVSFMSSPTHLTAPCPVLLPALDTPQDPLHSQLSHVTVRRSRSQKQHTGVAFNVWKSGLQGHNTQQNGTTTAWFGQKTFPLLSSPNCPVCSFTTFPFLSAPGLGHYISTKMEILLLCKHPLSQCQGSLRAISQPETAQPGKEHPFPAFLFLSHPFYPKLLPKEISILWCGRSCIYPQVIFDHCVNLSPANVLGR